MTPNQTVELDEQRLRVEGFRKQTRFVKICNPMQQTDGGSSHCRCRWNTPLTRGVIYASRRSLPEKLMAARTDHFDEAKLQPIPDPPQPPGTQPLPSRDPDQRPPITDPPAPIPVPRPIDPQPIQV
jgi:hypothetical protein